MLKIMRRFAGVNFLQFRTLATRGKKKKHETGRTHSVLLGEGASRRYVYLPALGYV